MPKTTMTLAQAARHLHMGEKTVLKLAKSGTLPGTGSGSSWTFAKSALDSWLAQHRVEASVSLEAMPDGTQLPLGDLLPDDAIIPDLRASDALGVIEEVAARAYSRGWLKNKPWFIGALVNRESLASTAMDGGVAFLHTRERDHGKIARPFVVVGRSYQGVRFGAPDGKPTYLFFLLGLTSDKMHLPILGRLARALKNSKTVSRLRSTSSPSVMRSVLLKEDDRALKGNLSPVEFPDKPVLNREIRKRAIMRVALRNQEAKAPAKNKAAAKPAAKKKAAPKKSKSKAKPAARPKKKN